MRTLKTRFLHNFSKRLEEEGKKSISSLNYYDFNKTLSVQHVCYYDCCFSSHLTLGDINYIAEICLHGLVAVSAAAGVSGVRKSEPDRVVNKM